MKRIAVLGSINMDLMVETPRLPQIGETILGNEIHYLPGGKGANQAVAAARLGIKTYLIGSIGKDAFGEDLAKRLGEEENLSLIGLQALYTSTGMATVFKTETDNAIIVIPGANAESKRYLVDKQLGILLAANVLLAQLEIPLDTVKYAFEQSKKAKTLTILNPAPYQSLPEDLLDLVDYITPNESEFSAMVGLQAGEDIEEKMLAWSQKHKTKLIVTRGSRGVSYCENQQVITFEGEPVQVVDTTGAGDTFNGALAVALAQQKSLEEAIRFADQAARLSVQKFGAQGGMPNLTEMHLTYGLEPINQETEQSEDEA